MTKQFFALAMKRLAKAYRYEEILSDHETLDVWYDFLSEYPDEIVAAAMVQMVKKVRAFPAISDVIGFIEKIMSQPWEAAWADANQNINRVIYPVFKDGKFEEFKFDNPMTQKVVDMIGPRQFMEIQSDQISVLRAQFRDIYNSVVQSHQMLIRNQNTALQSSDTANNKSPVALLIGKMEQNNKFIGDGRRK